MVQCQKTLITEGVQEVVGKKNIPGSKNGVFGKIVNEYGPKNKTGVQPQSSTLVIHPQYQSNKEVQPQQQQDLNVPDEDAPKKGTFHSDLQISSFICFTSIYVQKFIEVSNLQAKWDFSEQADLLMVFKNMLLGGLKKDNYKELAKRLNEIGWNRTNDQCRHEVNYFH